LLSPKWSRTNFSDVFPYFSNNQFLSAGHQFRASIIRKELVCYATASVHAVTTRKMSLTIAVISILFFGLLRIVPCRTAASRGAIELLQF